MKMKFVPMTKGGDNYENMYEPNLLSWKIEYSKAEFDDEGHVCGYLGLIPFWTMTSYMLKEFKRKTSYLLNKTKKEIESDHSLRNDLEFCTDLIKGIDRAEGKDPKDARFFVKLSTFLLKLFYSKTTNKINKFLITTTS